LAGAGYLRGTLHLNMHLLLIALIYPVWGLAQQFMLQAMVVRNLRRLVPSPFAVTLIGAVLFSAVHLPDLLLAGATVLLALFFIPLYLKDRNIIPLGLAHGLLGALAYFWLLGRDPYLEFFG